MDDDAFKQTGGQEEVSALEFQEKSFEFPTWIRWPAISFLALILVFALYALLSVLFDADNTVDPSKLGVGTLIVFSFLGIILFSIPWKDYGLSIRKLGPFEFEQILSTQAEERAKELDELRKRLEQLEERENGTGGAADDVQTVADSKAQPALREESHNRQQRLEDRLVDFLDYYKRWAFSPGRIAGWGTQQSRFTDLTKDADQIRRALQSLVAQGRVTTRVSKLGNTLYRIAR